MAKHDECTMGLSEPHFHNPDPNNFLMYSPCQQTFGYRIVDKLFATKTIHAKNPRATMRGHDVLSGKEGFDIKKFMDSNNVAGLLVIHKGSIVFEGYGLGLQVDDRWSTMSTVKSMTALLVGAAVRDGFIPDVDYNITRFLPEFKNTAYDGVTIRHLLTMSSGVAWSEDYSDENSHVSQYSRALAGKVPGGVFQLLSTLSRSENPGTTWRYNTGDTYLLGAVVVAATGASLADYMSEKIWTHCGMEFDGFYTLESGGGLEIGGSRAGMTLRDMGKVSQFVIDNGSASGNQILPPNWVSESKTPAFSLPEENSPPHLSSLHLTSYGYCWWLDDDNGMWALGHCGQRIYINPEEEFALVQLAAYPHPFYTGSVVA